MAHPRYAWMFFNWYNDNWWANISCIQNSSSVEDIEEILLTSLIFDHYPRIDEKDKDKLNVGNVVSYMLHSRH